MKIVWFSASVVVHGAVFAGLFWGSQLTSGMEATATGLTAAVSQQAARLVLVAPPKPEKSEIESKPEPELPEQTDTPEQPKVAEPQASTDDDAIAKVLEKPVEAEPAPVPEIAETPHPQPAEPEQLDKKEAIVKPNEVPEQQVAASELDVEAKPTNDIEPELASPEPEMAEQAQSAQQASLGQQGDNADKASVAGEHNDAALPWAEYKALVYAAINAQKIYPKQAKIRRIEGVVTVRFEVNHNGLVSQFEIIKKAKSRYLNRSTRELFADLRLPQPESQILHLLPSTMTVPIKYSLN